MAPRYNRRRQNRRRRPQSTSRKIMGYAAMAVSAYKMAKYLKSLINVEIKRNVYSASSLAITNTGVVTLWTNLAQGNLENQRNGNRVKAKAFAQHWTYLANTSTPFTTVRAITFLDRVSNGATPGVTDVLDSASYLAHYNNENAGTRFKILEDKTFDLNATTDAHMDKKSYIRLHHHVTYAGTDSTQAGCLTGHIYTLHIAYYSSTNNPIANYNNSFNYIDN